MPLVIGTVLGPYEITGSLGSGGMGEVYRARDAKLGRDVALKVLPDALAADPDRSSRFEREARTLAALNHPHIAHIYGFEQSGSTAALVMELVEGEDLSQRLARGPIPLEEALAMARQIAGALEAAHEQGIVHRDLKPANIKLRPDGTVKVLDFGLAKAMDRGTGIGTPAGSDRAESPTITSPAITMAGIILGTAAYMSPEQARGKLVDKRADIWAFGVVWYEMLSGRRLFDGATVSDSLAAVLTREPDWSHLPRTTPPPIVDLLQRCLRKDPARRLRDIGDAAVEIDDVLAGAASSPVGTPALSVRPPRAHLPWVIATVMTLIAGGAMWLAVPGPAVVERSTVRASMPLPPSATMFLGRGSSVAISPDGQQVVFTATDDGRTQLYVRSLNQMNVRPLPGTDGAANPFFSPDGQWVGFSTSGTLKKVNLQGGAVAILAEAPNIRGEAWGPDDHIVFTPSNATGLWRVPASGGTPAPLTKLESGELSHRWPQVVPGGTAVVFTIWNDTGFDGGRIAVQRLETGERRVLVQGGGFGRIVAIDKRRAYLVYAQAQGLMAAPFDLDRLELSGPVTAVIDAVATNLSGGAHFAVSQSGSLVYLPGSLAEVAKTVLWVDRTGRESVVSNIDGLSVELSVTRDGRRLVRINTQGPDRDVWVEDLERHVSTRLTGGGFHNVPILTPDDRRVIYSSGLPNRNLFWKSIDGVGEEERLTASQNSQVAGSVTPDGKTLAYVEYDPLRNADIWLVSLEGDHPVRPFLQTAFSEGSPAFAPDGRSIAYQSNQSGRFEIYVTSFPQPGAPLQVSKAGGTSPLWSRDGRELFYRNGDRMMAAPIVTDPEIKSGEAQMLFAGNYLGSGDLARDTGRFLMLRDNGQEEAGKAIHLVVNWFDELLAKVPLK